MIVGAIIFLLLASISGVVSPLVSLLQRAMLPFVRQTSAVAATVGMRWASSDVATLRARLNTAEERLTACAVDTSHISALIMENDTLRAQAHFLKNSGYDSVGARVISRDLSDKRARLLIDRGRRDHLERGDAVITSDGIFIGKISELEERVATVDLTTDERSRVAAAVSGHEGIVGVLEGRGNGAAVLLYVPVSAGLTREQTLVTAGTEEKIPAHLPFGFVNAVQGSPSDPFLTAIVEPTVPLGHIFFVSVLRPSALAPL